MRLGEVEAFVKSRIAEQIHFTQHASIRLPQRQLNIDAIKQVLTSKEIKAIVNQEGKYLPQFEHDADKDLNIVVLLMKDSITIITIFPSSKSRRLK